MSSFLPSLTLVYILTMQFILDGIITAHQQSCAKVMFSVLSVCQSVILSTGWGSHVTSTNDALDLSIEGFPHLWPQSPIPPPPLRHGTSLYRDPPPPPKYVQILVFLNVWWTHVLFMGPLIPPDRLAKVWFSSYSNAFLLQ